MSHKLLATCAIAAAITGASAVAAQQFTVSGSAAHVSPAVQPVVFGVPMPLDVNSDVPTAGQITGVLNGLADPGIPFANKGYLVEGGIGRIEARTADALMKNAVAKGQMPLNFSVADIAPAGPGVATATVTASAPSLPPITQTVSFVDQGGWKLSRSSAASVLSMFSA